MGGFTMQRCSECVCVLEPDDGKTQEMERKKKIGKKTGIWER